MSTQLTQIANPFQFTNNDIRTAFDDSGAAWFCAKDVCDLLEIKWSGTYTTLENIPEDWFMVLPGRTIKGERDTIFVNIAAVYKLTFRSNKPKANEFANWVCETVLPEIQRTGKFVMAGALDLKDILYASKRIDELTAQILATTNAFRRSLLIDQLRRICNLVNQPMPKLEWLALTLDQVDLFGKLHHD